jgi:hypothetical protein
MTTHMTNPIFEDATEQEVLQARFIMNCDRSRGYFGCWLWKDGEGADRYGRFWMNNKPVKVNRAAHQLFIGPLAEGEHVLHVCDVTNCGNPWHVYKGDHAQNMADRQERGRSRGRNSKVLVEPATPWTDADFFAYYGLSDDANSSPSEGM